MEKRNTMSKAEELAVIAESIFQNQIAAELRRLAALEKAIMDAEPVAVVGSTFQLLWSRQDWSEGIKVGDFLYTLNGIKP